MKVLTESLRILVTGGAGFIGSHLCRRLLEDGHYVTCLDDFSTGSRLNLLDIEDHDKFEIIHGDVLNHFNLTADLIYHLACPASPVAYQSDPVRTLMTSVVGTKNTLTCAYGCGARMLLASTSEVYGDPEIVPQSESYLGNVNTIGPRACYDEGKRAAEALCSDYSRQYGVDIRIARIFNTYGPRMRPDDGRVVSEFITRAINGYPLVVHGKGSQTRSFCYVDDLVDGLIRLMRYDGEGSSEPVNLGRPEEVTISNLAKIVISKTRNQSVVYCKRPEDDPGRRNPDISRATSRLEWTPETSLSDGLDKTVEWFSMILSEDKQV